MSATTCFLYPINLRKQKFLWELKMVWKVYKVNLMLKYSKTHIQQRVYKAPTRRDEAIRHPKIILIAHLPNTRAGYFVTLIAQSDLLDLICSIHLWCSHQPHHEICHAFLCGRALSTHQRTVTDMAYSLIELNNTNKCGNISNVICCSGQFVLFAVWWQHIASHCAEMI